MANIEQFSEEHSKLLLDKEWLVKIDSTKSIPYLIKFYHSTADLSCCVLLTDTKSVWAEVLSSQQFARRWRACNVSVPYTFNGADEDKWRTKGLEFISQAHTLDGIAELSFEVMDSNYADLAFELEYGTFKWRWEVNYIGRTVSAEIISKHLIFPLISTTHLTFSQPEAVSEIPDADLEKVVDKTGRTARRAVDTHIKNTLSKPKVATMLRRMTAMLNFHLELPVVTSETNRPDLDTLLEVLNQQPYERSPRPSKPVSQSPSSLGNNDVHTILEKQSAKDNSTTESDTDAAPDVRESHPATSPSSIPPCHVSPPVRSDSPVSLKPKSSSQPKARSDSESSPERPPKKVKKPRLSSSSDDDSEEERRRHIAQLKGRPGTGVKRGTRQPLKRGGKRF